MYKILEKTDGTQIIYRIQDNAVIDQKYPEREQDENFKDYAIWLEQGNSPIFVSWIQQQIDTLKSDILELQSALTKANILIERESEK